MTRTLPLMILLSCIALGFVLMFWFAGMFQGYLGSTAALMVEPPPVQRLAVGSTTAFQLNGSGFDRDTQVSLVMDVSNQDTVVNRYPLDGFFNASIVIGDLLLLGSNDGLLLVSIAVPNAPRLLERYLPGRSIVDLHYSEGKLFVSCGRLGLVVMSLGDGRLTLAAEIWTGDTTTNSHFYNGYLYVINLSGRLLVYDVSDATRPELISQLHHDSMIRGLTFNGDHLFLYDRNSVLYLYDCGDPETLKLLDKLRFESVVRSVLAKDAVLYVALVDSLWVFELEQSEFLDQLKLLQVWEDFGSIMSLIEGQHHLYLIDRSVGLRVLDLRDHGMSDQIAFAEGLQTLAEKGDYLYITGSLEGLVTIDRQQLRSRQVVKWIGSLPGVNDGIAVDDFLYLGFNHAGVGGVAFIDKQKNIAVHFADAPMPSFSLARYQHLLFVNQANVGVRVFDIAIPGSPQLLADWPGYVGNRLQVINDYLISYSRRTGFQVIEITDISSPRVVEQLEVPQIVSMVAVEDHLFCVTYDQGLMIYRLHDSGKLEQVSRLRPPFPAQKFDQQVDIDVHDGMAYIANGRSGLLIVDVRNPTSPQMISSLAMPGYSKGVRFHQNLVYLVTLRDGVHFVDVTLPAQPLLIGTIPLSRLSKFLLIDEDLLYFFQDSSGISVIPLPHFAQSVKLQSGHKLKGVMPAPLYPGRYNLLVSNRQGTVSHNAVFEIYEESSSQ